MLSRIRVLDDHTINQIAAGEVIENPSSVVKELVENSLDAGSSEICVEIATGGRGLIRVTDNGLGMDRDDALLCLERHATSKLKKVDDLASLTTMGFRGEAIPSIASISKFSLFTRTAKQTPNMATRIYVDGGRHLECSPCVRDIGTTVEVKNLFFNIPVRKKFQKSPTTDQNEILKILTAEALAHPKIRWELVADGNSLLKCPANIQADELEALKLRIQDILGNDFLEGLLPLQKEKDSYKIHGFIGTANTHRPNRQAQYLFVNGRYVSAPLLSYFLKQGYGPALPESRYPIFVLYLTLPSEDVDVNVHPQKREVRFRQEEFLKELLINAVELVLQRQNAPITPSFFPKENFSFAAYKPMNKERTFSFPPLKEERRDFFCEPQNVKQLYILACYREYLILENPPAGLNEEEGLCFVDISAAFARIFYERTLQSFKNQEQKIASQAILAPQSIELIPEDAELLRQNMDQFKKMGFELREYTPRNFFIDAVPEKYLQGAEVEMIKEILAALKSGEKTQDWQKEQAHKIALAASHSSRYIKTPLSTIEGNSLLDQLLNCQQPYFSPSGKATMAILKSGELANLFRK